MAFESAANLADSRAPRRRAWHRVMVLVALLAATIRVGFTIYTFPNVVDEPFHIAAATALYDVHKHTVGVVQPPFAYLVEGLVLHFSGVHLPAAYRTTTVRDEPTAYVVGEEVLFDGPMSYLQVLHRARWGVFVFGLTALLYVYLLGRWVGGAMTGALALTFFSLDPTLLGHWTWVHTDVCATAGFLAGLYHGARWVMSPGRWHALAAGVALGVALACKFTCVALIPTLGVFWLFRRFRKSSTCPGAGQIAMAMVVAFFTLWGTYLFNIGRLDDQSRFRTDTQWGLIPQWVKQTPVPMPSFWLGLLWMAKINHDGAVGYLNGELGRHGWWYYFPEAMALKSTVGFLLALALAGGCLLIFRRRLSRRVAPIALAAVVFLAIAMTGPYNLGIRHVLPVLALLYVLIAWQLVRTRLTVALLSCIAIAAVETAVAHPDYLSFFNVLIGGPKNGDRYLVDSNIDWGQDVGRLADWLRSPQASGRDYSLRIFMNPDVPLLRTLGVNCDAIKSKPHGLFAISKNFIHHLAWVDYKEDGTRTDPPDYSLIIQGHPRIARIGNSIEVYDLDQSIDGSPPAKASAGANSDAQTSHALLR